jgi:hypothetical protein
MPYQGIIIGLCETKGHIHTEDCHTFPDVCYCGSKFKELKHIETTNGGPYIFNYKFISGVGCETDRYKLFQCDEYYTYNPDGCVSSIENCKSEIDIFNNSVSDIIKSINTLLQLSKIQNIEDVHRIYNSEHFHLSDSEIKDLLLKYLSISLIVADMNVIKNDAIISWLIFLNIDLDFSALLLVNSRKI